MASERGLGMFRREDVACYRLATWSPPVLPLIDELAFILGNDPEAGHRKTGEDKNNAKGKVACRKTPPG